MTFVYLAFTAAVAFVIGYLLGDRRGVREANTILDGNMREQFKVIGEERGRNVFADDDGETREPVRH